MVASRGNNTNPARIPALGLRFLALIFISILLMYLDQRENHLDGIRRGIGAAVYPLRLTVDAPVRVWNWLGESTTSRNQLELELGRLNAERLLTNARLQRLTALEGVGPISAVLLYASLGTGEAFSGGREFAAYLGLTPRQFSSGGKTNIVGLSKKIGNCRLRSVLIQGARAYVHKLKEPKTSKDRWLMELIERAGHGKAAVALANKNVRTAWAMLTQGTEYQRRPQLKVAA